MELVCIVLMACFDLWYVSERRDCDVSEVLLLASFDSQHSFITAKSRLVKGKRVRVNVFINATALSVS